MPELELQLRSYGTALDRADVTPAGVVEVLPRRSPRSYVLAIAAVVVVALVASVLVVSRRSDAPPPHIATPGPTTPGPTTPGPTVPAPVSAPNGVLAIGDSVMEGATGALRSVMPEIAVDAVPSRQLGQAVDVLRQYESLGALRDTLVVALGTNAPTTADQLDAIMRAAGNRRVYFVTTRVPRAWEAPNNALLRALPARWENAHVIDWQELSTDHDEWFVSDGFHLSAAGQRAYAAVIASELGRFPASTPPEPSGLDVVGVLARSALPPVPLAVAGGEVWIATQAVTSSVFVRLEGHDPSTAKLLDTIDVPQEAVFGIAGDGDTLWVAGGGDGGVPETTVSKVDVRTKSVVFTRTLTGTPCSCPIVAGSAGVWLVGNGSTEALHLSSLDGHVIGRLHFANAGATAAMEVRGRLVVGLDDGSIAIVEPSRDRIEHTIPLPTIGDPPVEQASAMSAVDIPAIGSDPAVDGIVMRRGGSESVFSAPWQLGDLLSTDFSPATVTSVRPFVWVFGGDRLQVNSTHAVVSNEFAYDSQRHRFDRVPASPASQVFGFRDAVAVDNRIWVVYDEGNGTGTPSIVVINAAPDAVSIR